MYPNRRDMTTPLKSYPSRNLLKKNERKMIFPSLVVAMRRLLKSISKGLAALTYLVITSLILDEFC